jgi:hypothetical protein
VASYVEQATLLVNDKSSAKIKAINKELTALFKTAQKLKSMKVDFKINEGAVKKATADINNLARAANKAKSEKINVTARAQGLQAVNRELNNLRAKARRPIVQEVREKRSGFAAGFGHSATHFGHEIAKGFAAGALGVASNIGHAIGHAMGHMMKEGTAAVDIAQSAQKLRGLSDTEIKTAERVTDEAMAQQVKDLGGAAIFPRAEISKLQSDLTSIMAGAEPDEIKKVIRELVLTAAQGVDLGQDLKAATTGMFDYAKTGEQTRAFFKQGGKDAVNEKGFPIFDEARMRAYFEARRADQALTAGQVTGQSTRSVIQSSGVAKYGLTNEMITVLNLESQEMGSRAGAALQQMMNNLTGNVLTKFKKNNLRAMGMLVPATGPGAAVYEETAVPAHRDPKTGRMHKATTITKRISGLIEEQAESEDELRHNALRWAIGYARPKMLDMKMDPNNPTDVAKFVIPLTSGKGNVGLETLISQAPQLLRDLALQAKIPVKADEVGKDLRESTRLTAIAAGQQMESVLGEVGQQLATVSLPYVQEATGALAKLAVQLHDKTVDPATAVAGAIYGGAGLAGLAVTSTLTALTSQDPSVRALGGAAAALEGSAAALTASAVALGGGEGAASALGFLAKRAGAFGLLAAELALNPGDTTRVPGSPADKYDKASPEERTRMINLANTQGELVNATNKLAEMERFKPLPGSPLARAAAEARETAEARREVSQLQARVVELSRPTGFQMPQRPGTPQQGVVPQTLGQMLQIEKPPWWGDAMPPPSEQTPVWADDLPRRVKSTLPTDLPRKSDQPGSFPDIQVTPDMLKVPGGGGGATDEITLPEFEIKADSLSQLQSTSSTFADAFSSGAASISSAGAEIASSMMGAASGAGAIFGSTAAGLIAAAASSINVNVNAKVNGGVGGADTGAQTAVA